MRQKQVVFWQAGWLLALVIVALLASACQPAAKSTQQAVPVTGDTAVPTMAAPTTAPTTAPTVAAPAKAAPTATTAASSDDTYGKSGGASATVPDQVKLTVREDAKLGKYLADEKGMALYLYTKDPLGKSVCEGGCLANWPALLVAKGGKIVIDGVENDQRLGTVTRSDGTTQVAYNGYPLYYWVKDSKPGDVTGQGVGNVWFVVPPQQNVSANAGSANASGSGASSANAPTEVKLTVREDPKLGKFFADEKGMSLYLYTKDVPGVSVCEGGCLAKWPPLLVAKGGKVEIDGMDEDSNLGTITRSDGSTQVAYKGMALYYWVNDAKPGDVNGQGVGNVWFVVPPDTGKAASNSGTVASGGTSGNASGSSSGNSSGSSAAAAAAPSQVKLTVRDDAKLGKFLADEKGMTLYLFTKDTPGKSVCEGDCLAKWPPLLVAKDGKVEVEGMDAASKLGTITRSDGTTQVTYNGMPLYYWVKDSKPGDTTGQGVGSVWFVVAP